MNSFKKFFLKLFNEVASLKDFGSSFHLAAFDTVDHLILLNRLGNRFGICGWALAWFKSYLSDRFHLVSIRGARSATRPLSCAVPQGSVLGPILYLLSTSPLGDIIRRYNMGFHFYAHDTQLYLSFSSLDGDDKVSSVAQIESCVRDIDLWMARNKLKLNRDKTELLVIGSKHRPCPSLDSILVGDCRVHPSNTARNMHWSGF